MKLNFYNMGIFGLVGFTMLTVVAEVARSAAPNVQTPAPVIYLADNLDEEDRLGWCIDTVGRGFSDRLHAHSCKPAERPHGDVQFRYDTRSHQIMSATYAGKCAELLGAATVGRKLGLVDCTKNTKSQEFTYDAATGQFHVGAGQTLCLVVGSTSRTAGPFMSRDLELARCDSIDEKFKRWSIKAKN